MKYTASLLVLLVLFVTASPVTLQAASTSVTLTPTIDGFVEDGGQYWDEATQGVLNYSVDGVPDTTADYGIVQVLFLPDFQDRGILEFALGSVSGTVESATLKLNRYSYNTPTSVVNVYAYAGDGALTTADWSKGTLATSYNFSLATVTLDVTSAVQTLLNSGASYAGFRLSMAELSTIALNGPYVAYDTVDIPEGGASAATLSITTVPEPATFVLLGIVALGGWGYARRRR